MHPAVRIALVVFSLAMAAVPAWLAGRIFSTNLKVRSSWKRTSGIITSVAADNWVEVELRQDAADATLDPPRIQVPVDHHIGLSLRKPVDLYVDPSDPTQVRTGGLLQMWLWPAGFTFAALILLSLAAIAATFGGAGGWMLTPPPLSPATEIRIYRPRSEWIAPLFWSLLGIAVLACAIWARSAGDVRRLGLGAVGVTFIAAMFALSLHSKTTVISANSAGMLETSAFGWCRFRWEQLGAVEKQQTIFGRRESLLRPGSTDFFPGRGVTIIVFTDKSGRILMRMSTAMQPSKNVVRLFDLCAERTGLHLEFRRLYDPNM